MNLIVFLSHDLRWLIYIFLGALIFGTLGFEYLVFDNSVLEELDINLFGVISISIISLVVFFLIGCVIGLIIGKIKNKGVKR